MIVSIIVPVYNEEKTIGVVLKKLIQVRLSPNTKKEIIVVNDGSTDNTQKEIGKYKSKIISVKHDKNQGKGSAFRTGLKKATGDVIVIQDADLEYAPEQIPKLIKPFSVKNTKVVYGSRSLTNNKSSHWTFKLGGNLITYISNLLYGTNITDEATGYKLFRRTVLDDINLESKGFEICPELTAKISKNKIPIYEVPIKYKPRAVSEKKIKWNDGLAAIYFLIKYRIKE